ncbi:MAG: hypothetical protein R3B54_12310 [Bdellovibrionota bacterium]
MTACFAEVPRKPTAPLFVFFAGFEMDDFFTPLNLYTRFAELFGLGFPTALP